MLCAAVLQATMCRELFKLARDGQQSQRRQRPRPTAILGTRFQQWSFFCIAAFWMYLRCSFVLSFPDRVCVNRHPFQPRSP